MSFWQLLKCARYPLCLAALQYGTKACFAFITFLGFCLLSARGNIHHLLCLSSPWSFRRSVNSCCTYCNRTAVKSGLLAPTRHSMHTQLALDTHSRQRPNQLDEIPLYPPSTRFRDHPASCPVLLPPSVAGTLDMGRDTRLSGLYLREGRFQQRGHLS